MTVCIGSHLEATPGSSNHAWRCSARSALALFAIVVITACGAIEGNDSNATAPSGNQPPSDGGSANSPAPDDGSDLLPLPSEEEPAHGTLAFSGFVIDGPVSGADVRVRDANGQELAQITSDAHARFDVAIPEDAQFPLMITATGGINLTTAADPGFPITGFIAEAGQRQVVLSSLSTLVVASANCSGDSKQVASIMADPKAAMRLLERHGFGLDATDRERLLYAVPTTSAQAGSLLLASEALGETLRRAAATLRAADGLTQPNDVLKAVACQNAAEDFTTASTSDRLSAAFHAAAGAVLVETSVGELWVRDRTMDAVPMLQDAIASTFGGNGSFRIPDLPIHADALDQLLRSVHAALGVAPSDELFDLYAYLLALEHGTTRRAVGSVMQPPASLHAQLAALLAAVNDDPAVAQAVLAWSDVAMNGMPPPAVELTASPRQLSSRGASTKLHYRAEHATLCKRTGSSVGAWAGVTDIEAEVTLGPIDGIETFGLLCAGPGGVTEQHIEVTVPPQADVRFVNVSGADKDVIVIGDTVRVELDVRDVNVEQCEIRRSDNGAVIANGTQLVATAGLGVSVTCDGLGGTTLSSASIPMRNTYLAWKAPTQLENGQPLTDLAGFRIYYGSAPGKYDGVVIINDPNQREHTQAYPDGARYFAMTAVTSQDVESGYSNEAYRALP